MTNIPGFNAESALFAERRRLYTAAPSRSSDTRHGVVLASCATAIAVEVAACGAAAMQGGANIFADIACGAAVANAMNAC